MKTIASATIIGLLCALGVTVALMSSGMEQSRALDAGAAVWIGGSIFALLYTFGRRIARCSKQYVGNTEVRPMPAQARQAFNFPPDRTIDVSRPAEQDAERAQTEEAQRLAERWVAEQEELERRRIKRIADHEARMCQAEAEQEKQERKRAEREAEFQAVMEQQERIKAQRRAEAFARHVDPADFAPEKRRERSRKE